MIELIAYLIASLTILLAALLSYRSWRKTNRRLKKLERAFEDQWIYQCLQGGFEVDIATGNVYIFDAIQPPSPVL